MNNRRRKLLYPDCVASVFVVVVLFGQARAATFQSLSDLTGGDFPGRITGLSADGSTIIGDGGGAHTGQTFVIDRVSGQTTWLDELPGGQGVEGRARAVSGDGRFVVGDTYSFGGANGYVYDRWSGQTTPIVANPDPGTGYTAQGISADGSTVVGGGPLGGLSGYVVYDTSTEAAAQLDSTSGTPLRLSFLLETIGVSWDGSRVAGKGPSGGPASTGVVLDRHTGHGTAIGGLPGGNGGSLPLAMSADGSTVVGWSASANGAQEAFVYDADTEQLTGLGSLMGGPNFSSRANAVSANGLTIVGRARTGGLEDFSAFIHQPHAGMRSLNDLMGNFGLAEGWRLEDATGISADGLTIVGTGRDPDFAYRSWVISFREPPIWGDYNADGSIGQGDLDLVLLNWGATDTPDGFRAAAAPYGFFDGAISQNELDSVLLNWGAGTSPGFPGITAIPEPTTAGALLGLAALSCGRRRRSIHAG